MKLRPYPAYKESGEPWLGGIPKHWQSTSLGAISNRKSTRNRPDLPLLSVLREKGVVLRSSLSYEENHNFIPDDLSNYQVASEGDLVVNKMKAWQGSVGIAPQDGIVSPAYYIFELSDIRKKYAHRLLRSRLYADFFGRASDGIRIGQWDLGIPAMKRIPLVIPPPEEQDAIARYLDEMDRRIARFIRNRRRLIEVLNEQKQAIINRTVTRGLDPDAPLKPSGIDWIGDIPEHWANTRLKHLFREVDNRTKTGKQELFSFRLYKGLVPHKAVSEKPVGASQLVGYKHVAPGQMVMNRMRACIGMFTTVDRHGLVSPDYAVFNIRRDICIKFYEYLFKTDMMKNQFRLESKGLGTGEAGFLRLYSDRFGRIPVQVPPTPEQNAIVNHIRDNTRECDLAINRAEHEVLLIREYRTRLISDVVTGKVDVRHLAPTPGSEDLDEKVESLEPLEEDIADAVIDDEERVNGPD